MGTFHLRRSEEASRGSASRSSKTPGERLTSSLGVLLVFPGITLLVGVFLTWTGQQALRESNLDMARTRLNGRSRLVTTYLTDTLQTAEPILDDLTEKVETWAPDTPLPTVAEQTRQLLRGTLGVCFVSVSFEDGSFRGSFTQPDGTLHFLSTQVTPEGTRLDQFDFAVDGSLVAKSSTKGTFDPRQRPYYDSAVQADGRVWTEPYPFHPTERVGVARAQAVFRPNVEPKQLQAVVTVGFDVASLSRLLDHSTLPQQRTLLYTGAGQILAFSGGAASSKPLLEGSGSIGIANLSDDVATGYFKELELAEHDTSELPNTSTRWLDFSLNGSAYLAAEQRVGTDPEFDWHLAQVVPESVFLTSLASYSRQGYWVSGGAVFLALLGSFGFAQLVVRMRNATVRAQDRAREAARRAQELGSYQLLERLGRGGMGEVWRAEHRLLARRAAIKLIRQDDTDGDLAHAQERFRREARSLASLRSRNTIEIYDYGVADDGTFFYVMELLDGLDLESLVKHYGPQPAERVVAILIQACRSLAEAHDAGMVHRDIKPANLFLCRAADEVDLIKVLDFGLVKSVQQTNSSAGLETLAPGQGSQPRLLTSRAHLTQLDAITGTPDYMAPEQITGEIIDRRADLYALGCIGYWLLSGRTLFPGRALLQVLMGHLHDTPPSLASLLDPPPPPALIELLDDCLQKSPQARPPNARVVLERLQRIQFAPGQAFGAEQATAWWAAYQPIRIAEAHDPTHELSDQSRALLRSRMAEIPPTSATS